MKQERAGTPVTIGNIKLIPLERVSVHYTDDKRGVFFYSYMEPIGVVIITPHGQWAADINGRTIPLETYVRQIDGLQETLDSL